MKEKKYHILGLMSGSSLDGLDLALCSFETKNKSIEWEIIYAETIPYSQKWALRLEKLPEQSALIFIKTHSYLGHYFGEIINDFLERVPIKPDFIASHGHTIFHYPKQLITTQIGDGAAIAAKTGYPVICDFRSHDIALEGEGTPLAPTADKYLFSEYEFLLNLGGIANITYQNLNNWCAFDITPCNQVLNDLAQILGLEYDNNGNIARKGQLIPKLYQFLNQYPYYKQTYPKSLDNQNIKLKYTPKIINFDASIEDKLHTSCKVFGYQIAKSIHQLSNNQEAKILTTGGGAFNSFLIECIQEHLNPNISIVIPDKKIIEYKEALLMALLGFLRINNQVNCFSKITNANFDSIGGAIYQGIHSQI